MKEIAEIKLNRLVNNILYKSKYDDIFLPNYRYLIYSNGYEPIMEIDINKREVIIEISVFEDIMNIEYDRNIHEQILIFLKEYSDFNILVTSYFRKNEFNNHGVLVIFDEYEKDLDRYHERND